MTQHDDFTEEFEALTEGIDEIDPFPLTPRDKAAALAQAHAAIIDADQRATREMFDQLARRAGDDPRLNRGGLPYTRSVADISSIVCDHFLRDEQVSMLRKLSPEAVRIGLRGAINDAIEAQNEQLRRDLVVGKKLMHITRLGHAEIARLMAALYSVVSISPSSRNSDPDLNVLAAYDDDPTSEHYGTYRSSQGHLHEIARRYQPDLTTKEFTEIASALSDSAPKRTRGDNRDLIAVRNGIVDYNGGDPIFHEFSPEHIFLAKLDVDWNPDAQNPHIDTPDGDVWDVESWMSSLSDDPEVVELLWETTGAVVRPYVSWNKCAFYYSEVGNNGKGTLLSLQRNLLGVSNYASIPLSDFGKDFMLEPLTRASAILVDENDVGTFIDKAANFKAIVTNDVITINRKYKAPIAHQHFGFMVQCLNDKPTIKDKSESIYRRQLFIPFDKSFTGRERKYIKDEYLKRRDVLEYVLKRVLTMSYYELSEPMAIRKALDEFKEYNDPVRAFWNEVKIQFYWDLVPFQFTYDLFVAWMGRNMPNSRPIGRNKFIDELVTLVQGEPEGAWVCKDKQARHRPGSRMDATEPLIAEYDLMDWANVGARNDPRRFARIPDDKLKSNYRGLVRRELTDEDYLREQAEQAEEPIAEQVDAPVSTANPDLDVRPDEGTAIPVSAPDGSENTETNKSTGENSTDNTAEQRVRTRRIDLSGILLPEDEITGSTGAATAAPGSAVDPAEDTAGATHTSDKNDDPDRDDESSPQENSR